MKNIRLLLFIFVLPLFVFSQGKGKIIALEDATFDTYFENNPAVPVVKGKLINASAEELSGKVINYTIVTPSSDFHIDKSVKVRRDGTFSLILDFAFPYQQIFIDLDSLCYINIMANKNLFIEFDIKRLKRLKDSNDEREGVRYLGEDGPLNTYINNFGHYKQAEKGQLDSIKDLLAYNPGYSGKLSDEYFNKLYDSVFTASERIEKSYVSENPSEYSWILENQRLSDYYGHLCVRYWHRTMDETLWKRVNAHKSLLISNEGMLFYRYLYTYAISLPLNPITFSYSLDDFVSMKDPSESDRVSIDSINYFQKIIREEPLPYDTASHNQLIARFDQFLGKMVLPRFNQLLEEKRIKRNTFFLDSLFVPSKADLLKLQVKSEDPVVKKNIDSSLMASVHTRWTKKVLSADYQRTVNKIAEINKLLLQASTKLTSTGCGTPVMKTSFDASLYKVSGISAPDFLSKLKSSFPGKSLVVDFWATWCGPCLGEMPLSKKLHDETKGQPVEFIYLCTSRDSDEDKWKTKIAQLKQPGIHFFVDASLEIELMKLFSFIGYPSYAFFDKKGQYKPGAITWMSLIDKDKLSKLINAEN